MFKPGIKPKPLAAGGQESPTARSFSLRIASPQLAGPDVIPFHSNKISNGALLRGGCVLHSTHGFAILYIRTRDTVLDMDALRGIAAKLEMTLSPAGELSGTSSDIKAKVSFHQNRAYSFYAVGAYEVPRNQLLDAERVVEKIAAKLFEMKEEPHFIDDTSRRFRKELSVRAGYL